MSTVHLHLLLNHIPVVGTLFLVALFAFASLRGNTSLARTALWMCVALAAVAFVVFLTGEPAEEAVEGLAGTSEAALERHEDAGKLAMILISVAGVISATTLLVMRGRTMLPRWVSLAGFVGSLALAAVMGATANLGGQIRHSEIRDGFVAAASDAGEQRAADQEHEERDER